MRKPQYDKDDWKVADWNKGLDVVTKTIHGLKSINYLDHLDDWMEELNQTATSSLVKQWLDDSTKAQPQESSEVLEDHQKFLEEKEQLGNNLSDAEKAAFQNFLVPLIGGEATKFTVSSHKVVDDSCYLSVDVFGEPNRSGLLFASANSRKFYRLLGKEAVFCCEIHQHSQTNPTRMLETISKALEDTSPTAVRQQFLTAAYLSYRTAFDVFEYAPADKKALYDNFLEYARKNINHLTLPLEVQQIPSTQAEIEKERRAFESNRKMLADEKRKALEERKKEEEARRQEIDHKAERYEAALHGTNQQHIQTFMNATLEWMGMGEINGADADHLISTFVEYAQAYPEEIHGVLNFNINNEQGITEKVLQYHVDQGVLVGSPLNKNP